MMVAVMMRREFLEQWRNLSDEERHKFKKMAKEEHGKRKALAPRKPKKRKMQNRISLNSIVEIVQKFSEAQRAAVIEIGLGDLVEVEKSDGFLEVCKDLGVKKGEVKLKDLKDYLQKAKDADEVIPYVRHVPLMVGLGDTKIKGILHQFDEIGGYDNSGVVVHFRSEERRKVDVKTSGNECSVSHDSNGDVGGTNLTLEIVVGLLLCQNMLLERQLAYQIASQMASQVGSQMPGQLHQPAQQADPKMPSQVGSQMPPQLHQPGQQVDLNLVDPNGELHTHLMGAETSTPNLFEAHEDIVEKLKGDQYISSLSSNISYEMPFETSTPNPFETPSVVDKPKGDNHMRSSSSDQCNMGQKTQKRKIQQDIDEVVVSPSPLSGFKLRFGLSRDYKFGSGAIDKFGKRQILGYPKLAEDDLMKMCDSYFGETNFTADIRHCSLIYIPTNDRGSHWLCIKISGLHKVLQLQYGDDYQLDVSKFNIANVERQPLQDNTNCYDCGLFVIKFMQGVEYPSGVHVMDDVERPRLLLDLFFDTNNVAIARVMKEFTEWKFAKGWLS
ncbi:hypothetical protein C3L33_23303, partial [Rhododendron williamsianum]